MYQSYKTLFFNTIKLHKIHTNTIMVLVVKISLHSDLILKRFVQM